MLNAQIGQLYSTISALGAKQVAVAFSGGGDSTALLHALRDMPSVQYAFIIDHNLRQDSAAEADRAAGFALDLGYDVKLRRWDHGNPMKGIQVKAREYRYAAMGELCRQASVTHLLTAHTADDQAETLLMRQERQTGWRGLAGMRAESYGALWPALADVHLIRPVLSVSRDALREYNRAEGLSWIEDPSNENSDFTRVRARQKLAGDVTLRSQLLALQSDHAKRLFSERQTFKIWMSQNARLDPQGFIETQTVPPSELLLHLLRIVSGTGGPIDSARRDALCVAMQKPDFKAATLGGAWIVKTSGRFLMTRDKFIARGRRGVEGAGIEELKLSPTRPLIWDGRYLIRSRYSDITVKPAFGYLHILKQHIEIEHIFDFPKEVRPTLPVYFRHGKPIGFGVGGWDGLLVESLANKRLTSLWS